MKTRSLTTLAITLSLSLTTALDADASEEPRDDGAESSNSLKDAPEHLSTLAQTGRVLGGEFAMLSSSAGLAMHTLSIDATQSLALTEHLAALYHRDLSRRVRSRHWIFPTLKEISGVVTREGVVVMNLDEENAKNARLLPTLSFSTVGAKVRINF